MHKLKEFFQYKRVLMQTKLAFKKPVCRLDSLWKNTLKPLLYSPFCNIYVKASLSNTIVTVTGSRGNVIMSFSCGVLGFKGKKKRVTKFAIESTLDSVVSKLSDLGYSRVFLILNGFAKGRFAIIGCLKKYNVTLCGIRDITPKSHNGCRSRKPRRG